LEPSRTLLVYAGPYTHRTVRNRSGPIATEPSGTVPVVKPQRFQLVRNRSEPFQRKNGQEPFHVTTVRWLGTVPDRSCAT